MDSENRYIYGSAAPQLDPQREYQREYKREPQREYEDQQIKKPKINKKAKVQTVPDVNLKAVILCVALAFIVCFVLLYRYAYITESTYKLNDIKKEYDSIRNTNYKLTVEIEENTDLNKIKEIAENDLGMHKPDKYQIVSVEVPKVSYTIVDSNIKFENEKNITEKITDGLYTLANNLKIGNQ